MTRAIALAAMLALTVVQPSRAADPRYPDWPCPQAKVPEVSLAAVWAGPDLADVVGRWKDEERMAGLAATLGARRTPLEAPETDVAALLSGSPADKRAQGKLLFAG